MRMSKRMFKRHREICVRVQNHKDKSDNRSIFQVYPPLCAVTYADIVDIESCISCMSSDNERACYCASVGIDYSRVVMYHSRVLRLEESLLSVLNENEKENKNENKNKNKNKNENVAESLYIILHTMYIIVQILWSMFVEDDDS